MLTSSLIFPVLILLTIAFCSFGKGVPSNAIESPSRNVASESQPRSPSPKMKILYCTSWGSQCFSNYLFFCAYQLCRTHLCSSGFAKYFSQIRNFVDSNYPAFEGNILGDIYPPPTYAVMLNQLCGYIWMGGLAFMFAGNQIISALGLQNVELVTKLNNNKSSVIFGLFILNSLCAQLVSTGAFEVYVNDELVFSKLQMGRVPVVEDIIAALASRGILMR